MFRDKSYLDMQLVVYIPDVPCEASYNLIVVHLSISLAGLFHIDIYKMTAAVSVHLRGDLNYGIVR